MKTYAIAPFILLLLSLGWPHGNQDSVIVNIPPKVEIAAQVKTDQQVDSIYRHSRVPPIIDALKYNFLELRTHIDSLNALNIITNKKLDSASISRDSLTHVMLAMSLENDRIRAENNQFRKDFDILAMSPIILLLLVIVVAGSLISKGIAKGINNLKNHELE